MFTSPIKKLRRRLKSRNLKNNLEALGYKQQKTVLRKTTESLKHLHALYQQYKSSLARTEGEEVEVGLASDDLK